MVKEAESHAGEDRKGRAMAEARNAAETQITDRERVLAEGAAAIPPADRAAVEQAISDVRTAASTYSGMAIEAAAKQLAEVIAAAASLAERPVQAAASGDENIVDVDAESEASDDNPRGQDRQARFAAFRRAVLSSPDLRRI